MIESLAKLVYSLFALAVLVVYWRHYGARNFLWLSDIALFGLAASWWLESSLIASMIAVGTLGVELFWVLSFGLRLIVGASPGGLVEYLLRPAPAAPVARAVAFSSGIAGGDAAPACRFRL